jgi:DNA-directed RNA polymerase sigma subunit (sigma70/sigma32)
MHLVHRITKTKADAAGELRPLSHAEIGKLMGISRGRAFQIERAALAKIRRFIALEAAAAGVSVREWLFGE